MDSTGSLSSLFNQLENELYYPKERLFAVIIGKNPSQGARSPKLWNAAFDSLGISAQMLPMDVANKNLDSVLKKLSENPFFIGGAVAVPFKEAVADWLGDSLTSEAKAIGAVNCLFRDNEGKMKGTNTDGEAARKALIDRTGEITGKNILILGGGGAGKAVSAYMASGVGPQGKTFLACRNRFPSKTRESLLGISSTIKWDEINSILPKTDILVNCTTVGSIGNVNSSPVSKSQFQLLPANTIIYDIIYDPNPSLLLSMAKEHGMNTLGGLPMNFEQAVIAFTYAIKAKFGQSNIDDIRRAMGS